MVTIDIYTDNFDQIVGYQVSGHAGYGKHGKDIVCSAISVLAQTAYIGLEEFLSTSPELEIKDGWLKCLLPDTINSEEMKNAQVILRTMELGMLSTQEAYSKYIRISKRRWISC